MYLQIENEVIQYNEIGDLESEATAIFIPPGGINFDPKKTHIFLDKHFPELLKSRRIILFSYPGIMGAPSIQDATVERISHMFLRCLEVLKIQKTDIMGISFGGAVTTRMIDINPLLFGRIYLIASGEFFYFPRNILAGACFSLSKGGKIFDHVIYFLLVRVFRIFSHMDVTNLQNLVRMGKSIFEFTLHTDVHTHEGVLVFLENDFFVTKNGVKKLINKFPNATVYKLKGIRHTKKLNKIEMQKVHDFLKKISIKP